MLGLCHSSFPTGIMLAQKQSEQQLTNHRYLPKLDFLSKSCVYCLQMYILPWISSILGAYISANARLQYNFNKNCTYLFCPFNNFLLETEVNLTSLSPGVLYSILTWIAWKDRVVAAAHLGTWYIVTVTSFHGIKTVYNQVIIFCDRKAWVDRLAIRTSTRISEH